MVAPSARLCLAGAMRPRPSSPIPLTERTRPWVELKYFTYHPQVYSRMLGHASEDAKAGDLVAVYDKDGQRFGAGFFNPSAHVPLRMLHHGQEVVDEAFLEKLLDRACDLRDQLPGLGDPAVTDAYRVIASDADSLSGLAVDRYADTLGVEIHSLGVHKRMAKWLPHLHARLGTKRANVRVDPSIARIERITAPVVAGDAPPAVKIREHGIRYEVDFTTGHKTGFFCDQRENRRKLGEWVKRLGPQTRVADLCCYTGGFSLAARVLGGAEDVTGVDLDEKAIEQAKRNMNLNNTRINWVHTDAFTWARQMIANKSLWDVIILDPPKLVFDREDVEGRIKHRDLNGLAIQLAKPGALLVTCSCSGQVSEDEFTEIVIAAAHHRGRKLQFLERTGAGPDHPVMSNCPESRYLKLLWARVL
jgi:23S rRNA (cytosine1962-C5)-methyltransferase